MLGAAAAAEAQNGVIDTQEKAEKGSHDMKERLWDIMVSSRPGVWRKQRRKHSFGTLTTLPPSSCRNLMFFTGQDVSPGHDSSSLGVRQGIETAQG